jgi:DnaK suppressor protein
VKPAAKKTTDKAATEKKPAAKKPEPKKTDAKKPVAKPAPAAKKPTAKAAEKPAKAPVKPAKVEAPKATTEKKTSQKPAAPQPVKKSVEKPVEKPKATPKAVAEKKPAAKPVKAAPVATKPAEKVTTAKSPAPKASAKTVVAPPKTPTPLSKQAVPVKTEMPKAPAKATTKAPAKATKPAAVKPLPPSTTPIHGIPPYQDSAGEDYMSPRQLEHFRVILLAWKRELMDEVDRTVHHMQDESANLPDPNDRATQEEEFSLELRTRDRERKLIKKIDQTLGRIEEDDYGFCDDCGVEIGIRRLEARPTATLCIDCKSLAEIKEKQLLG